MSQNLTDNVPENIRWRDVYIVDCQGTLIKAIRVFTQQEANLRRIPYHTDWRYAYNNRLIKPKDNILCDDNFVVPIEDITYGGFNPNIVLATGRWVVPRITKNTRNWDIVSQLQTTHLTSNPHGFKRENRVNNGIKLSIVQLKRLVMNYLENGFDKYKAYGDTFKIKHPRKQIVDTVFSSPKMRYVLMAEVVHWFEKAGVTPDIVIQKWFDKVFNDDSTPKDIVNDAMLLYAKLHPDMEVKGLENPKMLPQQPNVYLGEQQHFQQIQGTVEVKPDNSKFMSLATLEENGNGKDTHEEEIEECKSEKEELSTSS